MWTNDIARILFTFVVSLSSRLLLALHHTFGVSLCWLTKTPEHKKILHIIFCHLNISFRVDYASLHSGSFYRRGETREQNDDAVQKNKIRIAWPWVKILCLCWVEGDTSRNMHAAWMITNWWCGRMKKRAAGAQYWGGTTALIAISNKKKENKKI